MHSTIQFEDSPSCGREGRKLSGEKGSLCHPLMKLPPTQTSVSGNRPALDSKLMSTWKHAQAISRK
jgi:hypothetical protein